jgi:hypothetical protein
MHMNTIFILVIVFSILYFYIFRPNLITRKYDTDEIKKRIIPLYIYQTWHTKSLPPKMQECVNQLKSANPEFQYHLYDDNECREFIKENYDERVLHAFDSLVPGTFKADLWRYCILYKYGGIYLDIKYQCDEDIKLIDLITKDDDLFVKEYDVGEWKNINVYSKNWCTGASIFRGRHIGYSRGFLSDRIEINNNPKINENQVYTGFMVTRPKNKKYLSMIESICNHVENKYYGNNITDPTGPALFRKYFTDSEFNKIKYSYFEAGGIGYIRDIYTKKIILKFYDEYRNEQKTFGKTRYWKDLWLERKIYKE